MSKRSATSAKRATSFDRQQGPRHLQASKEANHFCAGRCRGFRPIFSQKRSKSLSYPRKARKQVVGILGADEFFGEDA